MNFSPLREFLATEWEEVDPTKWVEAFRNLQEQDLVWRTPWLLTIEYLYRCYDHHWLMLLGLWGAIGCAPLLVSRQFGSRQFMPFTAGLRESWFAFDEKFKDSVLAINKNWKHCYRVKVACDQKSMVTPDYVHWVQTRANDTIPLPNQGQNIPMVDHLRVVPSEADMLRTELARAEEMIEKMGLQQTRDLFLAKVQVDKFAGEAEQAMKKYSKLKIEYDIQNTDFKKLEASVKHMELRKTPAEWRQEIQQAEDRQKSRAEREIEKERKRSHDDLKSEKTKGKETIEQYQQALKAEKDNTAAWKRKSHDSKIRLTESQNAYNALEIQLNQSRAHYLQLETRVREQEDMIREYQTRDEYAELQAGRDKIERLEKEVKDLWELVQTCQISLQVLEDIKKGGNDYWFTRLRNAAHRFQEQDKLNEKIMNLAQDVAEHVTTLAREARILRPHVVSNEMKASLELLFDQIEDLGNRFNSWFVKIPHPYFTRSKAIVMDMEDRMATMETNHLVLQDKFEKDLKEEIAQAQQNTVRQIAIMLGLSDPKRGKMGEESTPVGDSPYIPSQHDQEQSGMGTSRTRVQVNVGPAESVPINPRITPNHDPEVEIPNFDEVDDKSKTERKLEDRCEKLEELVRSMQNFATLGGIDARELSLVNDLVIPPKFKVPEFEKFTGTTCPSAHLTMYCRKMSLYLDNEKLLIHCFQDSLVGSAARWYTQLSRTHIKTWRDLSKAFLEQYKHVSDMVPSRTVLQTMEQKPNESFRQYAQRWRDVAAQVQPPLLENEITLLFVNTLKDDFYDRMLDHATKPFADMVLTGELIQAAIKSGRIRGGNDSRKFSKKRDNEINTTSSYTTGRSAGIIVGQPNHVVTSGASAQNSSKQETKGRGEKKEKPSFTPIPIQYEELFPKLVESRLVVPRYIAPIQPPYPPWFNPNVKCDYHAGNPGHHINDCTAFKYVVEQLLKAGMLSFEAPEKNPMPNHKGVNVVIEGSNRRVKESLADVTTPLKWVWEMLVENGILNAGRVVNRTDDFCEYHQGEGHEIQECQEFRQLIQAMMENKELEFFSKGCDYEVQDVCVIDDTPTPGNFAGLKPLIIKVGPKGIEDIAAATSALVIKAPAPFPYKDSKQVPWKYECETVRPQKAEENVNEVGNFTRSGRCYSQPQAEPTKNQKEKAHNGGHDKNLDDEPEPEYHEPVKETEAKEFLKILKHSEFNVVEQLNKLPARISMLSLLLSSEPHRNTLLKLLNQTFVPKEISIDMVDRLVGNIAMDNFISFSDEEIPRGARGSYKALHITTRCKGHTLPGVLIDNGSALNVLPMTTLKKLPIDSTHMKAYQNTVRAFDGTQRDVLGKITVPLLIGPAEYEVDFVVMDIKPTYSCLLGRPWIHAAGAVPSTLHQKLKFVIDGKLVTVQGEEDIIASVVTDTPYIEMDENAVECAFRSLELVSATFVEENREVRRPKLSRCVKMQVKQTLGRGARIGRGFGKQLQGRLYPIYVKGKTDRFGLGYRPDRRDRKAAIAKNQERRKARLTGEDVPWDQMTFPPIGQSFVSGGLWDPKQAFEKDAPDHNLGRFKNFSRTINGNENGRMSFTNEDLNSYFENLTINAVVEEEGSLYSEMIGPCLPGSELNNWIAEELPVVFKANTEFSDINGVSNIIPDSQIDFEQSPNSEEKPFSVWLQTSKLLWKGLASLTIVFF
ncbi:hypothetical protein GQ457_06G010010 [Hibiscus cannabinus]